MFKARVEVTLKEKILDPQGKAIESSLHNLGFTNLANVRTGKNIEFAAQEADVEHAISAVRLACRKLLANPVTEEYECEIFGENGIRVARFSSKQESPITSEEVNR